MTTTEELQAKLDRAEELRVRAVRIHERAKARGGDADEMIGEASRLLKRAKTLNARTTALNTEADELLAKSRSLLEECSVSLPANGDDR